VEAGRKEVRLGPAQKTRGISPATAKEGEGKGVGTMPLNRAAGSKRIEQFRKIEGGEGGSDALSEACK